jgi:hypothetical protein
LADKKLTPEQIRSILYTRELERRKMMRDKVYFIENYVYIENKDGGANERSILFKLFPEQQRVLKEIDEHKLNIIIKARQLGMTWLTLAYGLHEALKTKQFTMVVLSQTENYMQEAINRIEYMILRLPKWFIKEYNKETKEFNSMYLYEKHADEVIIYHPPREDGVRIESIIKGFVSTEKAARSITADYLLFDEWAYHEGAEAVFQAAYPTINRPDSGKFVGLSSNKRGSYFEDIVRDCIDEGKMGFNLIFLNALADPRRDIAWHEKTKAVLPNTWQLEYPMTITDALSAGNLTAFPEFDPKIHVCEPFPIPSHWKKWAAVDNGYIDPFVWIKGAIDEEGNIYVYYEYSRDRNKDPKVHYTDQAKKFMEDCIIDITDEVIQDINDLHLGFPTGEYHFTKEKIEYIILGLDAFNKNTLANGKSLLDFYIQGGMTYPPVKANTDRALRKSVLHEYLKIEENGAGEKSAKLKFFNTCKFTIKYLPMLVVDENNPNVVADNSKIDNVFDALGYLLIGSPRHNTKPIEKPETDIQKYKREKIKKMKKGKKRKGILN